jgi:hypothetical protein
MIGPTALPADRTQSGHDPHDAPRIRAAREWRHLDPHNGDAVAGQNESQTRGRSELNVGEGISGRDRRVR